MQANPYATIDASSSSAPAGLMCMKHPRVQAVYTCAKCSGGVCKTCDFQFPGNFHLCPDCATRDDVELSPKKKKLLVASLIAAGWASLFLVLIFAGAFESVGNTEEELMILGFVMIAIFYVPAFAGFGMAMSARERGKKTPISVWISITWNSVNALLAALLFLMGILIQAGGM